MKKLLIAVIACAALGGCITTSTTPTTERPEDPAMARVTDLIDTKMGCRPQPKNDLERQKEAIRVENDEEQLRIATIGMGMAAYNAALTRYRMARTVCRDKGAA